MVNVNAPDESNDVFMDSVMMEMLLEIDDFPDICSSSNTSSNSSDDDETVVTERRHAVRLKNFVESVVVQYDIHEFCTHFRMTRETAHFIIDKITMARVLPDHSYGREKILPKKAFLMSLWYISNNETFRQISDRFNVSKSSAHRTIKRIMNYLVYTLAREFIKWPNAEMANKIAEGFYKKGKIFGVIGAIDCSHIRVKKPVYDQEVYCNRKGYHSILLQAVCDDKKRFIDICCGEAGSLHDARCLRRSKIYEQCQNRQHPIGHYFLLGDSAYPVLSWLIPPYKDNGHLTNNHHIFNYRHSASRIVIEHAFGLLKCRFRKLLHIFENVDIDFVVLCTVGACVLHNICINRDDLVDVEYCDPCDNDNDALDLGDEEIGVGKRNEIFQQMFM